MENVAPTDPRVKLAALLESVRRGECGPEPCDECAAALLEFFDDQQRRIVELRKVAHHLPGFDWELGAPTREEWETWSQEQRDAHAAALNARRATWERENPEARAAEGRRTNMLALALEKLAPSVPNIFEPNPGLKLGKR